MTLNQKVWIFRAYGIALTAIIGATLISEGYQAVGLFLLMAGLAVGGWIVCWTVAKAIQWLIQLKATKTLAVVFDNMIDAIEVGAENVLMFLLKAAITIGSFAFIVAFVMTGMPGLVVICVMVLIYAIGKELDRTRCRHYDDWR